MTAARLVQDAGERRPQIEAALALGASPRQCTASVTHHSVRLAMVPFIDSMKTMGIVFLPGTMTGMILAGADPLQAVRLQVVAFVLLAAVSLTATLVSLATPGRLFTTQQQQLGARYRPPPYAEGAGQPFGHPPPRSGLHCWRQRLLRLDLPPRVGHQLHRERHRQLEVGHHSGVVVHGPCAPHVG